MVTQSDRFTLISPTACRYIPEDSELYAELQGYEELNELERLDRIVNGIVVPRLNSLEIKLFDLALENREKKIPRRIDGQHEGEIAIWKVFINYVGRLAVRRKQIMGFPLNFGCSNETEVNDGVSDLFYFSVSALSVEANIANDIRHQFRSEINEASHRFYDDLRVGSSTMPHKKNPVEYEQIVSLWKTQVPRLVSAVSSQIVEHQGDSTNAALPFYTFELECILAYTTKKLENALNNLIIN